MKTNVLSIKTVYLQTSEGSRDFISGRCSGQLIGQPFGENVLKGMTLKFLVVLKVYEWQ